MLVAGRPHSGEFGSERSIRGTPGHAGSVEWPHSNFYGRDLGGWGRMGGRARAGVVGSHRKARYWGVAAIRGSGRSCLVASRRLAGAILFTALVIAAALPALADGGKGGNDDEGNVGGAGGAGLTRHPGGNGTRPPAARRGGGGRAAGARDRR